MSKRNLLATLVFGALWGVLIHQLSIHWALNPQYSFGWLVPFLGVVLLFPAWQERPAPEHPVSPGKPVALLGLSVLLFFPTWLLAQPNPDWRLVSWALGLEIVVITLCAISLGGGKPWVRQFAFPVCFILTAIPWPTGVEILLIQNLMRAVAWATVELLGLMGIAALQHGNVIEISSGMLGVDEACSGVRSLQASLMAAIFLGQLYRCCIARRFALIGLAMGLAIVCNLARATFLAWEAAHHGMGAIAKYHDPAGIVILTICFVLVWLGALLMAPPLRVSMAKPPGSIGSANPLPTGLMVGLGLWFAFVFGSTEYWFRIHERGPHQQLTFIWPDSKRNFRDVDIPAQTISYLNYDQGRAARWLEGDQGIWHAFYFKWNPGPARSRILARSHRPEICLPASGFRLQNDLGDLTFALDEKQVLFHGYTFEREGHNAYIFFCTWEDGHPGADLTQWTRFTGLNSVLKGERNLGQEVVEFVLLDYESAEGATESMKAHLPRLLRVSPGQ